MTKNDKIALLYALRNSDSKVLNHEELGFIISAVSKQIGEEPIVEVGLFGIKKEYTCPVCGNKLDIDYKTYQYCEDCGQMIEKEESYGLQV